SSLPLRMRERTRPSPRSANWQIRSGGLPRRAGPGGGGSWAKRSAWRDVFRAISSFGGSLSDLDRGQLGNVPAIANARALYQRHTRPSPVHQQRRSDNNIV